MQLDAKLTSFFAARPEVIAAYLFGSRAQGVARRDSDTDVAVLPDETVVDGLEYRLGLAEELERLLGAPVDVVVLPDAPLLLQFQVFKHGRIVFERDADRRALYQARAMAMYYDHCRYLDFHGAALRKAIRERGLGRG
ncbi:MAG TPA: nucleotidyltransferase domain-containing protein [Bacillota bacterium]|nr:nucleotidyltransferase domain-containing protein [Bacillota bacterium]